MSPTIDVTSDSNSSLHVNFAHIKEMYNLELGKNLKIAYKSSEKVLNPLILEKTNVMLADACFHESTINGLKHYGERGYPHFLQTSEFLQIIRNWWNIVNVKSVAKGRHKRNNYMKPIKEENRVEILAELQKFANWVKRWQIQFADNGLSKPTFETLSQTVVATIELSNYLLDEKDEIVYVLLGFIQSDYLEGRFGWYRQLSGANYYNSVLQFIQAKKTIRLRCLVNSGYTLKEIKDVFEIVETTRKLEMQLEAIEYLEQLSQFTFTETSSDVPITYYIAGYVSRGLMNHLKCKGCQSIVSDNSCPLTVDIEQVTCNDDESQAKDVFLNAINRGGLTKPSDLVFVTCTHSSDLFKAIQNDSFLSQQLINCANSQSLFVEIFRGKLEEVDCTNSV